MRKFTFSAEVTVSAYTEITAETEAKAREIAVKRPVAIGGPNSGEEPSEVWVIEEADGDPENIRLADDGSESEDTIDDETPFLE